MQHQNRRICLLIDNAPSHLYDPSKFPNITIVRFEPNMTSHVQPMDAGVIRNFKVHYSRLFNMRAIANFDAGIEDFYEINQYEAMVLAKEAWSQVSAATIANCWKHTQILPQLGQPSPAAYQDSTDAEDELSKTLEEVAGCFIGKDNICGVADLVDDEEEKITEAEWTDEDILDQARRNLTEAAGGDDPDPEPEPEPIREPFPFKDALKSLARIELYMQDEQPDSPLTPKVLSLFPHVRRELRKNDMESKKQVTLDSFFK